MKNAEITAVMQIDHPEVADRVNTKASRVNDVGAEFQSTYQTKYQVKMNTVRFIPAVDVGPPVMSMAIQYKVTSSSAEAIAAPTAASFALQLDFERTRLGETSP